MYSKSTHSPVGQGHTVLSGAKLKAINHSITVRRATHWPTSIGNKFMIVQ